MLDFSGAALSLLSTYYFTQAKRFAWMVGLFAVMINSVLYYQKGLYGYLILETIYFVTMIYGWITWTHRASELSSDSIRRLRLNEGIIYGVACVVGSYLLAQYLINFTDSDIPYWDAISTSLCLLAQWLLCRKVLECWIVWFVVDAIIAGLQFYKGIPFHSLLHWIYLGMAVMGYLRWYRLKYCQLRWSIAK